MTELDEPSTLTFPLPRTCPFAPPAEYRRIREEAPISKVTLPNGQQAWVVSRHDHLRTMLTDPRFSSDRNHPAFPQIFGSASPVRTTAPMLVAMDPPEHGPARRKVIGEFTVKRMRALQARIQQIVDEHVDAMLAGPRPADLVQALSLPVPSLVICELLGVPYRDHVFFQTCTSRFIRRTVPAEERRAAFDDLRDYLDDLVAGKEQAPGDDDLLGRQILQQRADDAVDHEAMVSLALLLLVAGHETTANMISLGTVMLLENPEHRDRIVADPGRTPDTIEELLRTFTIAEFANSRVAVADVELGGVVIHAGEGVLALGNSANHDPDAFPDPDTFDPDRRARHHVAFGYGAHQCLGQNLARVELQIVFDTLFRRVPSLRLAAPVDDLPFKDDAVLYGVHALPVSW